MLAAMHVISELGMGQLPMSELAARTTPYFASGEINSAVTDRPAALARVRQSLGAASEEEFDGTTFFGGDNAAWWWANIRPSNTEPLLRLNVESNNEGLTREITDRAVAAIRNS